MIAEATILAQLLKPKEPDPPKPKPIELVEVVEKVKPKTTVYKIKQGDSLSKLSKRFRIPVGRLLCANRQIHNSNLIYPGNKLKIPHEKDKLKCPKKTQGIKASVPTHPIIAGFTIAPDGWYPVGQCTQYVWSRRPVGMWGNASEWLYNAQRDGVATGSVPRAGAVGWTYGHVVYIEKIKDNQVYLSERNYDYNGSYRERWANASDFTYIY